MATVVNTPGERGDGSAGWAVAVVILLVVIAGIAFWYMRYRQAPAQGGATIQVNLPTGGDTNNGSGGGNAPGPAPAQ